MPINGQTIFGYNSSNLLPISMKFCMEHQKATILYSLCISNPRYIMLFDFFDQFWQGNGLGRHMGANGSGTSKPTQKYSPLGGKIIRRAFSYLFLYLNPYGNILFVVQFFTFKKHFSSILYLYP